MYICTFQQEFFFVMQRGKIRPYSISQKLHPNKWYICAHELNHTHPETFLLFLIPLHVFQHTHIHVHDVHTYIYTYISIAIGTCIYIRRCL